MIIPIHNDVHPPIGSLYSQDVSEMVDEYAGIAEIIEQCTARSTLAGDAVNHWCTRGAGLGDARRIKAAGLYGNHP